MKYLKKFETTSQYEAYTADTANFVLPNVSLCKDGGDVHYNPILSIENAVITCDSATYNGQTQVATNIVVTLNGSTLVSGTDYTVSNNDGGINVGNYTFTIDGIGNYGGSKNGTFTIVKVTPTVTTPTAKVLTYNGSAQELVNAGSTNFGTLKYSLDNIDYSTSIPTATNYGSYTVYYKVDGDSNVNDVAAATVPCSINEKQVTATVELDIPQGGYTYDGTAKEPSVTVKDGSTVIDPSEYTVTYSNNINAGTATVTISDNVGGNYEVIGSETFSIAKVQGSVTTAPTAITGLTPTGSAQALVNAGSSDTGEMMYNLNDGAWSSSIPTATNVGSYTVGYKAAESTNYTESDSGSVSVTIDYPYVEIGGTKWATMNVGANSATDTGLYFQWGDISGYTASQVGRGEGQKAFKWADYKYCSGAGTSSSAMTKYNSTDGKTVLDASDDAVQANWGGSWRMPTSGEMQSLIDNTTTAWTTDYQGSGVPGMVFTDKTDSSKVLFFRAAGYCDVGDVEFVGSYGYYWSSSLRSSSVQNAHYLSVSSNDSSYVGGNRRFFGFSVRGVVG